jgi:hypothetical protein
MVAESSRSSADYARAGHGGTVTTAARAEAALRALRVPLPARRALPAEAYLPKLAALARGERG